MKPKMFLAAQGLVLLCGAVLQPGAAFPATLEKLTDRCKSSVRIEPSLIYDGNQAGMVPGNESPIRLKRVSSSAFTEWTEARTVGLTSERRFAWFCGPTADSSGGTKERSRCPQGTNRLQARLGPDRLLEVRCLD
jgi:hypothetical protein